MSHDTWIHRAARGVARPLARSGVSANQITTLRLALGLLSIGLFASGNASLNGWALLAFVLSMLCDRLDGEVARLTGTCSEWGHRYDLLTDAICDAGLFVGIGLGAVGGPLGGWAPLLGVASGLCVAFIFRMVLRFEKEAGSGAAGFTARAGFDPDDAIVIAPILAAAGFATPLLVVAALATPIAGLVIRADLARRRARHRNAPDDAPEAG